MMIVMKPTASEEEIAHVVARVESVGARVHISKGEEVTVIGAIGDVSTSHGFELEGAPGVAQVVPILKPTNSLRRSCARRARARCSRSVAADRRRQLRADRRAVHRGVA